MASIYQRGRIWWICYMDHGRKIDTSLKTKEKKIAQYHKNEIENKISRGDNPLPDRTKNIKEAFEEFKVSRQGRLSENHQRTDNHRINLFINECYILRISHIKEHVLKEHLDKRIENDISHQTANHTIRAIKTFLNFCIKKGYLFHNPLKDMHKYPINQKEPRFLSPNEVNNLLILSKETSIYIPIAMAVFTGMRQGEIMRTDWQDVDFKNNDIRVIISKSKKFRRIPLHDRLKCILAPLALEKGLIYEGSIRNLEWEFIKIKRQMPNSQYFRFHDLRHTFASLLVKSGVDIYTVSKLLGHANLSTTAIYAHLYDDHIRNSIKKLDF